MWKINFSLHICKFDFDSIRFWSRAMFLSIYSFTLKFSFDDSICKIYRICSELARTFLVRNVFVLERKTGFTSSIWKNRHKERVGYAVLSECDSFRGVPCDDISFEIPSLAFPFTPFTIHRTQLRIMRDSFRRNAWTSWIFKDASTRRNRVSLFFSFFFLF